MRALIVGAGLMGQNHALAARSAGALIAAIIDPDERRASTLAQRFPGASTAKSLQDALEAHAPDVVHICTPADSHCELGGLAAGAGCHALIEKPVAADAQATRRLIEGFTRARRLACPTHQYACQRSVRAAATLMPELGALRQIAIEVCSAGGANGRADLDSLVADILPHPLSVFQKLAPAASVASLDWSCLRASVGEWLITAPFRSAVLSISMSMNGRPTRFRTRIVADRGSLELDNFHDYLIRLPGDVSRVRKIALPFVRSSKEMTAAGGNLVGRLSRREFAYPGLRTLVSEFYAAAATPSFAASPMSPEETIAVAEARDQIIALARHG